MFRHDVVSERHAQDRNGTEILKRADESQRIVLDLVALRLVDWDVVKFLSACEENGVRLGNCPDYIGEWMARGKPGAS